MSEDRAPFTHFDAEGRAKMVAVGQKTPTERRAVARADVVMQPATLTAIRDGSIAKGTVLGVARVAGIMAAKKTSDLIPLCHPLALTSLSVDFEFENERTLAVKSTVEVFDRTGAEMEAMTAAAVAALTIYDMCKAVDRGMEIRSVVLLEKSGGKSGTYRRAGSP